MKAPAFAYAKPATVREAVDLMARFGDDARVVAGGQSLLPALNMRLLEPQILIDINALPGLADIRRDGEVLRIGALARHVQLAESSLVREHAPLLALAAPHIAHAAIRNRGTFGGSLAQADPAAEWPACALALRATLGITSLERDRQVAAANFFTGLYETALVPGELLTHVDVPIAAPGQRFAFEELSRRKGDYAIAGIAAAASLEDGRLRDLRLACFGVSDMPVLARATAAACEGAARDPEIVARAQDALHTDLLPRSDPTCSGATRMHLLGVLLSRILDSLWGNTP